MLIIDGAQGEGGGQILRTSLALSLITGQPFRLENIRAGRKNPGLQRQHLASVQAAAAVGKASVQGAALASRSLTFEPGPIQAGDYSFAVGTAGSATLVFQTILPALLRAPGPSTVALVGGTHNSHAPPFEFLGRVFLPVLARMGASVGVTLERPGFYPAGGGRFRATVSPVAEWKRLSLLERGKLLKVQALALVARLSRSVGDRELFMVEELLDWPRSARKLELIENSHGPGNALLLEMESEQCSELVTGFGERGARAEDIARTAAAEAKAYLDSGVPVGEHLADQLLLPMALAGGGSFRTVKPSEHTRTNAEVIRKFLPVQISMEREPSGSWIVQLQ